MFGNWYKLRYTYPYWDESLQLEHKFNFCFLIITLSFLTIGLESPKATLFYKFTSNKVFKAVLLSQLIFVLLYYSLSTTVFQERNTNHYYPSYRVWLSALAVLIVLVACEEETKKKIRILYKRDHSRLSIFFQTRLGMYSPR